jgi:ABC-2 type transport system ATP-binding protein
MLSTHIMQEVEQLCDRVIIINKGEIVADQPIKELQHAAKNNLIIVEFEGTTTASQLKKLEGVITVKTLNDARFELESAKVSETKQALLRFALENKLSIVEISEKTSNLEAIFQQLTKSQ